MPLSDVASSLSVCPLSDVPCGIQVVRIAPAPFLGNFHFIRCMKSELNLFCYLGQVFFLLSFVFLVYDIFCFFVLVVNTHTIDCVERRLWNDLYYIITPLLDLNLRMESYSEFKFGRLVQCHLHPYTSPTLPYNIGTSFNWHLVATMTIVQHLLIQTSQT